MPLNHSSVRSAMASASGIAERIASRFNCGQRLADSAGHHPRRVNSLAAQPLDDLLAELAQADAVARQLGILLDHAEDVRRAGSASMPSSRSGEER